MKTVLRSGWIGLLLALSACNFFGKSTDFTLMSDSGPVSLKDFRGKVVLLYFGYTMCPDVCPMSLSSIAAGIRKLTPQEQEKVQVLFVSVDPERDTLDRLKMYASAFYPTFLGISGAPTEVAAVAKSFGAHFQKAETKSAAGYMVDHSTRAFVVGPKGDLQTTIPHGTKSEDVAQLIRKYLPS